MATRIGFVIHTGREAARRAAETAVRHLGDTPVLVCSDDRWHPPGAAVEAIGPERFGHEVDVVMVFGGDGTFLRAAHLVRDHGVPLLGVDLGRLGFLSEISADSVTTAVDRLVDQAYEVEERMTVQVSVHGPDDTVVSRSWALNEASVERTVPQRLIVLEVRIGSTPLASIPADAMICATPTGSTAYAFSARGPVISPLVDSLLLVPVAPHSLFDRPIVVDPTEAVRVTPAVGHNGCVVSTDGMASLPVPEGGWVEVQRGEEPVRMVRLEPFDFYRRLRDKFGLR